MGAIVKAYPKLISAAEGSRFKELDLHNKVFALLHWCVCLSVKAGQILLRDHESG